MHDGKQFGIASDKSLSDPDRLPYDLNKLEALHDLSQRTRSDRQAVSYNDECRSERDVLAGVRPVDD